MDRNHDVTATEFALQILRNHPQISYEHAVSAAEYSGVDRLPRRVFFAAAERLGIARDEAAEVDAGTPAGPPKSKLEVLLDQWRTDVRSAAAERDALLRMREVVHRALEEDAVRELT